MKNKEARFTVHLPDKTSSVNLYFYNCLFADLKSIFVQLLSPKPELLVHPTRWTRSREMEFLSWFKNCCDL